jgi:hypothetical protein
MSSEPVLGVVVRMAAQCSPEVARSTIPIFAYNRWQMLPAGTGVLFQIASARFIFTAAHVARGSRRGRMPYFLAASPLSDQPIRLRDAVTIHTDGDHDDQIDVGVIELSDAVVGHLRGNSFLRPATIDMSDCALPGVHLVMGFPKALAHSDVGMTTISAKPLRFVTTLRDGLQLPRFCEPSNNIVLDYSETSYEDSGDASPSIDPDGMSGGGIWRLASEGQIADWSLSCLKLVGIQHTWSQREGYVKGTWIRYAVMLIWDRYPGLRRAIQTEFKDAFKPE